MNDPTVIVYMNLGPYHVARCEALAQMLPSLHVIEVASEQRLYPWRAGRQDLGFPLTTLFSNRASEAVPAAEQRRAVKAALSQIDPAAVIVAGYREPVMRAATGWARQRGRPAVLWFVSTLGDAPRVRWKELAKRRVMQRYAVVAAAGQRAEEYALRLGAGPERVRRVGNVVDNDHYALGYEAVRPRQEQERRRLRLPDLFFLTVSRLTPEKNLGGLVRAFSDYRRRGGAWDLVIVGSGPDEAALKGMVRSRAVSGVHFVSWRNHEQLPVYYSLASCFVLASVSEAWGLVVNEAMACGLPVLVSDRCGCVPELCHAGENGYTFDPTSVDELTRRMIDMSSSDGQRTAMGQASRRIVESFTPATWARQLRECVVQAMLTGGVAVQQW